MSTRTPSNSKRTSAVSRLRISRASSAATSPQSPPAKPRVVPWLGHKIEKAVDAACAAVGHEPIGKQIQAEVEFRMKKERPLFIHIEQLQDLVRGAAASS